MAQLKRLTILSLLGLLGSLASLLLLTACGPGTGGTGTGPLVANVPSVFNFSSSVIPAELPIVKAPTAPDTPPGGSGVSSFELAPTSAPGQTAAPAPAPAATPSACAANCTSANPSLLVDGAQVRLQTRCARFVSSAPFVVTQFGDNLLTGTVETQQNSNGTIVTRSTPAVLVLQFSKGKLDSDQVTVRLVDSTGAQLLSPFTLYRDAAVPILAPSASAGSCN